MSEIPVYFIALLLNTALLMGALWIMIKFQDMNYTFLGLLGAAAVASGLDMIPFIGHPLAVVALYICIAKVTHTAVFGPDGIFTVAIAYALKFLANLFIIGSLMGDLRPDPHAGQYDFESALASQSEPLAPTVVKTNPPLTASPAAPVVAPVAPPDVKPKTADEILSLLTIKGGMQNSGKSSVTFQFSGKNQTLFLGETSTLSVAGKLVPVKLAKVDGHQLTFKIAEELVVTTFAAPTAFTADPVESPGAKPKTADEIMQLLTIKGVTQNSGKSVVLFHFAGKSKTVFLGETVALTVDGKYVPVKLEKVDDHWLTFKINEELVSRPYN